jgi:type I restriction enzyme, S subunit
LREMARNTNQKQLPETWTQSTLGEVCLKPQYGWTTKGVAEGSLRLLRTTDITPGSIAWGTVPFCAEEPEDTEKYLLQDGDIVVSRAGSIGVSHLVKHPEESVFASYLIRFKPLIDQRFVAFFLKSPDYWRAISESSSGIALLNVNAKKLQQIPFPLPPLTEQRRIVEKIEELFTKLDAGLQSLKQAQALLKKYRQSVLKAAVEGELTREWREAHEYEAELASALLERILDERRKQWPRRYKAPTELQLLHTHGVKELPEGWVWTSLSSLLREPLRNGHSAKATRADNGLRTLTLTAVTDGDFSERNTKLTTADPNQVEHLWLEPGDILIERANTPELVGTTRLYTGESDYAIYPDLIIRARLLREVSERYVELALQSNRVREYFKRSAQGIAGSMPKISQSTVESTAIPLPPKAEQESIVREVEKQFSVLDRLDATIEANLARARHLRQSILNHAFSGRLVPQDADDEPASVLVDRIKEEREGKVGRKRKRKSSPATDVRELSLFPKVDG